MQSDHTTFTYNGSLNYAAKLGGQNVLEISSSFRQKGRNWNSVESQIVHARNIKTIYSVLCKDTVGIKHSDDKVFNFCIPA